MRWGARSAAVTREARLLLGRHVRGREHTIQFAAAQALGREKRGSEPRGTRRTTWLAQCTEPYIDVMDEKSMTLTSPLKLGCLTIWRAVGGCTLMMRWSPRLSTLHAYCSWCSCLMGMISKPSLRMKDENSMPLRARLYFPVLSSRTYSSTRRRFGESSPMMSSSMMQRLSESSEKTQSRCMRSWLWSKSSRTTPKRRVPSRSLSISCWHAFMSERRPMPSSARSVPTGKKSPPSRKPPSEISPAIGSPSFVKQKRITCTSRWRCSLRRRPITTPLHVVICWSRV
mmetsp:Transcript_8981/g.27249  ORF Transcript_8981/g.27249 Transcript_8981/m.27249 type:complete len:285 (+) Transcript_8981:344-1198(+)